MRGEFCLIADDVVLGSDVKIYNFVNLYGCEIGDGTKIGTYVEIQKGVRVGRNCKISSHTFICEGLHLEDEVFVGHGVQFINDKGLVKLRTIFGVLSESAQGSYREKVRVVKLERNIPL